MATKKLERSISGAMHRRWSRGHKAGGQGYKKKKNPRPRPKPRTALPRTDPLKAKDRNPRGQGHRCKCSPKKKVFKKVFQAKKVFKKIFLKQSPIEEDKIKVFANFPQGFWRFPTKIQRFKNSAVLEPRIGQFSRT